MAKPRIRMENAPDWYDTPLDQLDFQWSPEEKLEIERYCEKIHKNIAEEEMTPRQRFAATIAGKEKDRCFITPLPMNVYAAKTLDSGADAVKPIDVYRNPKLLVKAHLAFTARFKSDICLLYTLAYSEDLWGGKSKLIDYGNPVMMGDPPIKTVADLEGLEVPNPKKHGLYPGYLWAVREIKKILVENDLDDKLEFQVSTCPDSVATAMLGMTSISGLMIASRKDPELCHKSVDLADKFVDDYCQSVIDLGAHSMWICYGFGWLPVKGNEWVLDHHVKIAKAIGPQLPTVITYTVAGDMPWLPLIMERGIMGPGGYAGWTGPVEVDYKKIIDAAREYNIYTSLMFSDKALLSGDMLVIEEQVKSFCDYGKSHPKFALGTSGIDYWTPQHHVEAALEICRKYAKY
jgi:uroporphyrinogen-III decarboxylase